MATRRLAGVSVAGVGNVVLKTNYEGDVVKRRGGTTTTGGGDFGNVQWIGGKTGDNWSLTYAFEYFADEPVFAFQRDFMDSRRDNPLPGSLGVQPVSTHRISRSTGGANSYFAPPAGTCSRWSAAMRTVVLPEAETTTGRCSLTD